MALNAHNERALALVLTYDRTGHALTQVSQAINRPSNKIIRDLACATLTTA
jgi:hypothetical protein